jgi:hypothetical protein
MAGTRLPRWESQILRLKGHVKPGLVILISVTEVTFVKRASAGSSQMASRRSGRNLKGTTAHYWNELGYCYSFGYVPWGFAERESLM